jgi:transcriptional regulator with XRE-family HTH domain
MKKLMSCFYNTDKLNLKYRIRINNNSIFYADIPKKIINTLENYSVILNKDGKDKVCIYSDTLKGLQFKVHQIINEYVFIYKFNEVKDNSTIGQKFAKIRKNLKLTQKEAAHRIGVGLRFLREFEQGKVTIKIDKFLQVINFFGYDIGILKGQRCNNFRNYTTYSNWTSKLRKDIRQRDNYCCQVCKMLEKEHKLKYRTSLHVHHIDSNKNNNCTTNLISLCIKCHSKVKKYKKDWSKKLKTLVLKLENKK